MAQRGEDIPPGEFYDSGEFNFGTSKMVGLKICFLLQVGIFVSFQGYSRYSDVLLTPPFWDILAIFGQSCWWAHFFLLRRWFPSISRWQVYFEKKCYSTLVDCLCLEFSE